MPRYGPVLLVLLIVLAACGGDSSPTSPSPSSRPAAPTATSLSIQAPTWFADSREIEVGETVQLRADIRMSDGTTREGGEVEWQSSNTTVATVNGTGLVTARQQGSFDLSAMAEGITARVTGIRVVPAPEPWSHRGTGNTVFDKPRSASRVRVIGEYPGSSQNFIVHCGGRLLINVILGTSSIADGRRYDGVHNMGHCGEVEITSSAGVRWSFTEQ